MPTETIFIVASGLYLVYKISTWVFLATKHFTAVEIDNVKNRSTMDHAIWCLPNATTHNETHTEYVYIK